MALGLVQSGHNGKAVHRAYAKQAQVIVPALEEFERKIVPLHAPTHQKTSPAQAAV